MAARTSCSAFDHSGMARLNRDTTRHLRDVLRLKGHDAIAREFAGGHDYLAWIDRLADGLVALDPH